MGHQMLLLVTSEPVQGQAEARRVVWPPSVLIVYSSGDRCLLLQPLLHVRGGQLVIPVIHQGQAGVGHSGNQRQHHRQGWHGSSV